MKIEFTSLESEPLLYFLLHSGIFVVGMGVVFFLLGMWFGALTWGHHRRNNRRLHAEGEALREEVAGLKRKLAEQNLRPGTAPLPAQPPALLLTEGLPKVTDIFPERAAAVAWPVTKPEEETPAIPSLPVLPEPLVSNHKVSKLAEIKTRPRVRSGVAPSPSQRAVRDGEVEPFSFLMTDSFEEEPAAHAEENEAVLSAASVLGFIIEPATPASGEAGGSAPPSVIPENDPTLGLIFKEPPPDVDDLTRVQGISPALQNRLQELGVFRLQQIAAWNQTQVREFSRHLAFKDRIDRERWVEQARQLMTDEPV